MLRPLSFNCGNGFRFAALPCCGVLFAAALGGQTPATVPPRGAASIRWEPWSAMRSAATAIVGWKIGVAASAFRGVTMWDAGTKIDALGVGYFEGSATWKFNEEIPKDVGPNLAPNELTAVRDRLYALNLAMTAYRVASIPNDDAAARRLFEFAKALGVETIVLEKPPTSLVSADKLATAVGVNIAIATSDPVTTFASLEALGPRIGLAASPAVQTLDRVKSRLFVVHLTGPQAEQTRVLAEMYRLEIKPSLITAAPPFDVFEKALQPVLADRVLKMSKTAAIRGPERLTAEARSQIDGALPTKAAATPKKPRKLLVLDLNIAYNGHQSIPAENYALEQMGKRTGAWDAVFSNDLDNLKYPRIKDFDAICLNNTVGMIFVDPAVREGLLRFVREGGGLAGNHGTSHVSMDWPEFHDMIGVVRGIHRENTEKAWIRIDDPGSPLTAPFGGNEFLYMDEFFRFPTPPYSREKLHVLLTIDVERTDMNQGRACQWPCARSDHDYAVSWIREYSRGRVFFAILGHQPTIFTTPALADYFLRGIQYVLGDLDADATPGSRRPSTSKQ